MANPSRHEGSLYVSENLRCRTFTPPAGCIDNQAIADGADVAASKLVHRQTIDRELFESATTIANKTQLLKIIRGATGTVVAFQAAVVTKATGTDRTVGVDLQKSTGGGAFASILTAPILFDDGSVNLTPVAASIADADLEAGDLLQVVVAVAGSDANQALGLVVSLTQDETPS